MKKFTSLLTVIALLISMLSLFACTGGSPEDSGTDAPTSSVTTAEEAKKIDLSGYVIVRPEKATDSALRLILFIADKKDRD